MPGEHEVAIRGYLTWGIGPHPSPLVSFGTKRIPRILKEVVSGSPLTVPIHWRFCRYPYLALGRFRREGAPKAERQAQGLSHAWRVRTSVGKDFV